MDLTCVHMPWSNYIFEKLAGYQLVKKFPHFIGPRRFITAFTSACHLSLSWATSIQSMPVQTTSLRSILIVSSHLRVCLPSGLFPSGFPTKNHIHLFSPPYMLHALPLPFFCIWSHKKNIFTYVIIYLFLFSFSIATSTSKELDSGTSGSVVHISVCLTSLTTHTFCSQEKWFLNPEKILWESVTKYPCYALQYYFEAGNPS